MGYLLLTTVENPWVWKLAGPSYLWSQVHTDLGAQSVCCKYLPQVLTRLRYLYFLLIWFIIYYIIQLLWETSYTSHFDVPGKCSHASPSPWRTQDTYHWQIQQLSTYHCYVHHLGNSWSKGDGVMGVSMGGWYQEGRCWLTRPMDTILNHIYIMYMMEGLNERWDKYGTHRKVRIMGEVEGIVQLSNHHSTFQNPPI